MYPGRQAHVKLPTLLLQMALALQLSSFVVHSLISVSHAVHYYCRYFHNSVRLPDGVVEGMRKFMLSFVLTPDVSSQVNYRSVLSLGRKMLSHISSISSLNPKSSTER